MRRGPAVVLLLALLLASGYGARRVALEGWSRLSGFSPAHFRAPPTTAGPPPMAGRLVLIMVDGLRPEDTNLLPTIDWLTRQGSRFTLATPAPAFPVPLVATVLTGAPPVLHGSVLPPERALHADSLPAAAARVRMAVGAVGPASLGTLTGSSLSAFSPVDSQAALLAKAQPLLAATGPRLVILEIDRLSRSGSALRNPAGTSEYLDALGDLDSALVQIIQQVDLKRTAVVVTGTVPTRPDGTHPPEGQVPLVMAGPGIVQGKTGTGALVDIAPTVAALLGTPTPLQNEGAPLFSALAVSGRPADVVAAQWLQARKQFADAQLQTFGAAAPTPDAPTTLAEADGYLAAVGQQIKTAQIAYWKRLLIPRLPYVGGLVLALLLYLLIVFSRQFGGPLLLGVFMFAAGFHALFFLAGGRYSAAMAGLETIGRPLYVKLALEVGAAMLLAALVTGVALARRGFRKSGYLTMVSLQFGLAAVAAIALPVSAGMAFVLWDFPVRLPAPGLLIWFFLTALAVMVIAVASPLWVVTVLIANRITHRIWPLPETPPQPSEDEPAGLVPSERSEFGRSARTDRSRRPRRR